MYVCGQIYKYILLCLVSCLCTQYFRVITLPWINNPGDLPWERLIILLSVVISYLRFFVYG